MFQHGDFLEKTRILCITFFGTPGRRNTGISVTWSVVNGTGHSTDIEAGKKYSTEERNKQIVRLMNIVNSVAKSNNFSEDSVLANIKK